MDRSIDSASPRRPPVTPQERGSGYVMSPREIAERARNTPARPDLAHGRQPAASLEIPGNMPFSEQRRLEEERGIASNRLDPRDYQPGPVGQDGQQGSMASAASVPAMAAATGSPQQRVEVIELEIPVECSDGSIRTSVTLRRPKWGAFEEYLAHPLVTSKKLSANSAMVAACAGVPLDFMLELDFFDGMKLTNAVMDFFPQVLRDKLSALSSQS
jgi:hypothetical protein